MIMEFSDYIGIPWEAGAEGPDSFDCMSFTRVIQKDQFNIDMPPITIPDYDNHKTLVGILNTHVERENWIAVDTPQHGDAVLIRSPMHYGTWLDIDGGGVIHCVRGIGVIFTKDSSWPLSGFGRKQYLRHRSKI